MSRYLVNLKKGNDYLVPKVFGGIDTTNLLASYGNSANVNYTATANCFVLATEQAYQTQFKINNVAIAIQSDQYGYYFPAVKGDVITGSLSGSGDCKIWGIKFNN